MSDTPQSTQQEVRWNPDASRYEITLDGQVAGFLDVRTDGDVKVLPHTKIFAEFEGRGLGSALVRGALDDFRSKGELVEPRCPFVRDWIDRHPDYHDIVAS